MRQVLMQRGNHIFIRYCAGESVFAGFRRIAKLATSIAIAVAFTGIALPTSSAQAQTATLAAGGQTRFAENETSSFTLTLGEFPTDLNPAIATVEVELRFLLTDPQFSAPTGTTYSGPLFDVIVTGNDGRVISTQTAPQASKRIRVSAAFNPNDSAAGVGQPAVITYTIHPNDITENAVFRVNRPGGKKIIFKDSSGNPITVPGFRQPSNNNLDFTITPVLAEDAVFVKYTYQNGDTIPNIKTEEPDNIEDTGVGWNPLVGINLTRRAIAEYPDGTEYECDSSSSGNCQILFPSGRIANGGPVNATFPEESAPPAPTIPTPPPPVAEPQEPRLIYTYENLEQIPVDFFHAEEPTNASATGVTWTDGVSLALTQNAVARYDDGTTYTCLSGTTCVITFANRQINNGGQVQVSAPFDTAAQFLPDAVGAEIMFDSGITDGSTTAEPFSVGAARPIAGSINEDDGTTTGGGNNADAGVAVFEVSFFDIPDNVTKATCVYGFGGDAEYGVDYTLVEGSTPVPLTDTRFDKTNLQEGELPTPQDLDDAADGVDHRFTVNECDPAATQEWSIKIIDDSDDETNEPIAIFLRQVDLFVSEDELGSIRVTQPDTLLLTIQDDDTSTGLPEISAVTDTATATEGGANAVITFTLSQPVTGLAIDYGIFGGDSFTDDNEGLTAADIASVTIDTGTETINSASNPSEIDGCTGITDVRCGTLTITSTGNAPYVNTITIAANDDLIPEGDEAFTFFLRGRLAGDPPDDPENDPDEREANVLFPNFGALANRSAKISITDNDAPSATLTAFGTIGAVTEGGGATAPEFTLQAAPPSTQILGYIITGIDADDITFDGARTFTNGDPAPTPVPSRAGDPRRGTFTLDGTQREFAFQIMGAADNILEGTETATLTLLAGDPDETSLPLATSGAANSGTFTITDATDVTARLSWPGRTERPGVDRGNLGEDGILPIGTRTFPGGALEGASPHVVLDLRRTTGINTNPNINADDIVTVARDMFFPVTCTPDPGCGAAATFAARRALEAQIERTIDDRGTTSGSTHRDDDLDLYGVVLRAGQSREAVGVDLLNDERFDEGDEVLTLISGTPTGFRTVALPADLPTITPEDARITILNRPSAAEGTPVTWHPESQDSTQDVTTGAGAVRTKVSELVLELAGGFTGDHQAVSVVYRYETNTGDVPEASLGSLEWWVLNLADGSRLRRLAIGDVSGSISDVITVSRTLFSPIQDGTPTVRVGLFFSPTAAPGAGGDLVVNVKNVKHIDGITGTSDRVMCSDNGNDNPLFLACDNQEFSVGESLVELTFDRTASEAGSETGHVTIHFAAEDSQEIPMPVYPAAATSANIPWSISRESTARIGEDYDLSLQTTSDLLRTVDTTGISITGLTSGGGDITVPRNNMDDYITIIVTPRADARNEPSETVIITIGNDDGVTFTASASTVAINRDITITIANQQVVTLSRLGHGSLFGQETTSRATNFVAGQPVPLVRFSVSNIPSNAWNIEFDHEVLGSSTAEFGTCTSINADGRCAGPTNITPLNSPSQVNDADYLLYRRITNERPGRVVTANSMSPNEATGTRDNIADRNDRDHNDSAFLIRDNTVSADYWLYPVVDSREEGDETVVLRLTGTPLFCNPVSGIVPATCAPDATTRGVSVSHDFTLTLLDSRGIISEMDFDRRDLAIDEGNDSNFNLTLIRAPGGSVNMEYTIADESRTRITGNSNGITAADFNPDDCSATGVTEDEMNDDGIVCKGTISGGNGVSFIERLRTVEDGDGEDDETFLLTLTPVPGGLRGSSDNVIPDGITIRRTIRANGGGAPTGPLAALSGTSGDIETGVGTAEFSVALANIDPTLAGFASGGFVELTLNLEGTAARNITELASSGILGDSVQTDDYIILFSDNIDATQTTVSSTTVNVYVPVAAFAVDRPDSGDAVGAETVTFTVSFKDAATPVNDTVIASLASAQVVKADQTPLDSGGDITASGAAVTYTASDPGELVIAADPDTIVESDPASTSVFTISGAVIPSGTDVLFTLDDNPSDAINLTATYGTCTAFTGGVCTGTHADPADANNTRNVDYFLTVPSPHTLSVSGTTGTITAGALVDRATGIPITLIPRPDDSNVNDTTDSGETVILAIAQANNTLPVADAQSATVTLLDPGIVRLASTSSARVFAVGGVKAYTVEVAGVGVADGAVTDNNQPVRNRAGADEIDVVIDLTFPNNNPDFAQDGTDANLFTGRNYNVELNEDISDDHRVFLRGGGNTIRIIVPQTSLRRSGASGGNLAGGEQFNFQITAKAAAPRFDFDMTAYTARVGNAGMRRDTLNRAGEQQRLTFVAAPPVVLTNALADNTEILGTQGIIPAEADVVTTPPEDVNNTLTYTLTNDTGLGDISQPVVSYTLRIAPADGGAAISNEIDFITGANDADVTIVGTPFTAASGAGNENVREITIHRTAVENMVDAGNDVSLVVPLRAGVFSGADRRFTISLHNVRVVSSDARLSNAPPPAAQSLEVFVAASTLPTAELRLTGPLEIEPEDNTVGGLDTTTIEVVLDNIPATSTVDATEVHSVRIDFDFSNSTTADTSFTGNETDQFIIQSAPGGAAGISFSPGDLTTGFDYILGDTNSPKTFSFTIRAKAGATGNIVPEISDIGYLDDVDGVIADLTLPAERIIQAEEDADRTIAIVAEGEAPLVSLLPADTNERIAENSGSFAELTVSLANLPATIATSTTTTATVGSVRVTINSGQSNRYQITDPTGAKTINLEGNFLLELPPQPAGLLFLNETRDEEAQVIIPAGTTEAVIKVTLIVGGTHSDNIGIAGIAWYDDASTPEEITSGVPVVHTAGVFTVSGVANPVVADLSADGPTRIGTGGGDLGMTEFSLTLTNLQNDNVASVPVTFGSIGGTPSREASNTQVDGDDYVVDIIETTGDGDPADATFTALTGEVATVGLTAPAADAGEATIRFRITSKAANVPNFTVSLGTDNPPFTVTSPNRNEVVQTASLAYSIIAVGDVRSVRFVPADLTVIEGGNTATTVITLTGIPTEIPPDVIGSPLVTRIDITLRADGLTFNQAPAGGQSITLGDGAATLSITTAGHEFVNTVNPATVILRAGVNPAAPQFGLAQDTNITFTGGFVNSDMEFTLRPTGLAYFTGNTPLVGPGADEVHFLPGAFSVNVMPISASIAADQNRIVVDDVGGGEVVISMENLPVSSETESVQVDVTFGTGVPFNFVPATGVSSRLGITGVSNADGEDYTLAYSDNMLSITVPRPRLLASTGEHAEARGEEEITVNFTALTADAAYNVAVSGSLMDGSDITFAPGTLAFTTVAAATATLKAHEVASPPSAGVDPRANEENSATAIGQWILRLNNVAVPTEDVVINYTIPALEMVRTAADDILDATPVTDYTLSADHVVSSGSPGTVEISEPEGNPTEGYTGTLTIGANAYVDPGDGITDVRIDISVTPVDDNIVEGMEDVRLTIAEVPGAAYTPEATDQKVRITDNDTPVMFLTLNGQLLNAGEFPSLGLEEGLIYPVQLFVKNETVLSGIYSDSTLADDNNLIFTEAVSFTVTLRAPNPPTDEDERADVTDTASADVRFSDGTALLDPTNTVTVTIPAGATSSELVYIDIADEDDPDDANEKFSMAYEEVPDPLLRAAILRNPTNPSDPINDGTTGNITINREATASTNLCAGRTSAVATAIRNLIRTGTSPAYTGTPVTGVLCDAITSTQLGGIAELDLSSATLTSLQPGDFAGLPSLTTLDLSGDNVNIRALPAGVFDPLVRDTAATPPITGIQTIDLSGNSLTDAGIPDDVFDMLTTLETLNLGDNDTLTSLPAGLLDGGSTSGALYNLASLTLPDAIQGRLNFAMDAVTIPQGGSQAVTMRLLDAGGNPQTLPVSLSVALSGLANGVTAFNMTRVGSVTVSTMGAANPRIVIPAGVSSVEATFAADSTAATGTPSNIELNFAASRIVVAGSGSVISYSFNEGAGGPEVSDRANVRRALFADTANTIAATVVAPVALDPADTTAAELNNAAATVQLNLGRTADDVGTADVTFELSGGNGLGTDYNLAITDPDGNAVNNISGTALALAVGATTGTFRLPTGVSAATFTLTPIADGFPSTEGNEVITITITEVDYNGAAAPDAVRGLTVAATVTIMDNTAAPQLEVIAKAPEEGDTELTEGSADGRGTFTIDLSAAPDGMATVFYTLAVDDETDPNVAFDAIDQIRLTGLGGERPVNPEDTTTPNASPRMFTMNVASGAAMGSLAFTAANDADQVGESVVFTVTGVTFADDGDGTDIGAVAPATISIVDATPDSSICTRTQQVYEAILDELNLAANLCMMVENGSAALMTLNPSGGLTVDGLSGLKAGDFADLDALTTLSLTGSFTSLPAGVFDEPIALTSLTIDAALTGLPADVFDNLAALETLNIAGSTTLTPTDGALEGVLDTLTSLTWPTPPAIATFVEDGATVGRTGSTDIRVQLDAALPVAVSIPVTAETSAGVTIPVAGNANAIIPAGSVAAVTVSVSVTDAAPTTNSVLRLGTPELGTSSGTFTAINPQRPAIRTELIANPSDTATLTVVDGPTATLRLTGLRNVEDGGNGMTGGPDTATFEISLINITPASTDTLMVVVVGFGDGAANNAFIRTSSDMADGEFLTLISNDNTGFASYILDASAFSSGNERTIHGAIHLRPDNANAGDTIIPRILSANFYMEADPTDSNRLFTIAGGDLGTFNGTTSVAPGNITNPTAAEGTITVVAPATLNPATADIREGGSAQTVTLRLNRGAPSANYTIRYTVTNDNAEAADYTITANGDSTWDSTNSEGTFVFAANATEASIDVLAVQDFAVDNPAGEGLTITLDADTYNGFTIAEDEVSTELTIVSTDEAPGTVSLSPTGPEIFESGSNTSTTITVRLNAPAVSGASIVVGYAFNNANTDTASPADYTVSSSDCVPTTPPTPTLSNPCGLAGTLTFEMGAVGQRGDQIKTIMIEANDDDVDESDTPPETLTLTLTSVTGGTVSLGSPREATITIEERNVVPEDVMKQVETVATVVATEHVTALTTLIRQRFSATSSFGSLPRVPSGAVPSTTTNLSLADNPENMNDMINSMGLEKTAQGDSNNQYAVWIRGQRSVFEGTPEIRGLTIDYDGTTTGIGMGAEYSSGGYLAGLAMNYVTTEVDLSSESEGETISKYEESMVIAAPYFSLKAGEGTSLWASVGVGTGTADAKLATQTKSADVSLTFLNAGADFTVIGRSFEIVTGLSGLVIRKVVDSFTFTEPEHILPKTTIDTMQAVGEVTIYRPIPIAGQIVRPYMGISTIHDFGDIVADDDHGLGIRTGVAFGLGRVSADIELSSELLRENRRQWTVSGGARFASRPGGQGLSLSLDGTQETQMDTGESVDDDAARTWGIGLEGGYGMPAGLFHPDGVLTPFASIDQAGDGRDMSGGVRFSVGNGLSLDLETTRQMHDDSEDASEHKAGLRGRWSF